MSFKRDYKIKIPGIIVSILSKSYGIINSTVKSIQHVYCPAQGTTNFISAPFANLNS